MRDLPLGKKTAVPKGYDPGVLYPIPRGASGGDLPGFDLWRGYELSWLDPAGKPVAAVLELAYPAESKNIVESKSLKLYLGGLSNARFSGGDEVREKVAADLGRILEAPWIDVRVLGLSHAWEPALPGICIDGLEARIPEGGEVDPGILSVGESHADEALHSHLLRTSCPVTLQPDWASALVKYRGPRIEPASLLGYLCSYRSHAGFGEECCGRIYRDILARCRPGELTVALFYTRRGGIDINPVRSSRRIEVGEVAKYRLSRQ